MLALMLGLGFWFISLGSLVLPSAVLGSVFLLGSLLLGLGIWTVGLHED